MDAHRNRLSFPTLDLESEKWQREQLKCWPAS